MTERPVVRLDRYADPTPTRRPRPVRRWARKAAPFAAVLAGTALLVGSVWKVADVVWSQADPTPVVLPNTFPTSIPQPSPVARYRPVEQAPDPAKKRAALVEALCLVPR